LKQDFRDIVPYYAVTIFIFFKTKGFDWITPIAYYGSRYNKTSIYFFKIGSDNTIDIFNLVELVYYLRKMN
jgi:hypothetical protein